jgi:signal transduction histidine kinase
VDNSDSSLSLKTYLPNVIPILIAGVVLFGWHTNQPRLIQIHADWAPMQYNTALGFLACGLAGIFIHKSRYSISKPLAFFLILLGGLTLAEYVFNVNLSIDEMFKEHSITTKTSHPGRMAPNTALCFTLMGLFFLLSSIKSKEGTMLVRGALGLLVFALGIVALSGYLMGLENAYGWGNLTRMAFHTASGFIILGFGAVLVTLHQKIKHAYTIFGFVGIMLLLLVMGLISIAYIDRQASISEKFYRHPFVVSNAARHIDASLISIHRYMKDVVLSEDEAQLNFALDKVEAHSKVVLEEFEMIFQRYLGDKEDIQQTYLDFLGWEEIREEVISLIKDGRRSEAAEITKGKGAKHVASLNESMQKMILFAKEMAESFRLKAVNEKKESLLVLSMYLLITLIISIIILISVIRNLVQQQVALKASHERLLHTDKLSSLGKLTGSIAHEFNNPIFGMKTLLEQVKEEATLEDNHAKFLGLSIKQCERMADLVRKLQGFYRPSLTVKKPADIHQVIDSVLTLLHKRIQQRHIHLKKYLADGLPEVNCVSDQIQQVLLNIVQNAEEAISEETQDRKITITTEKEGDHVKIHVQDSGGGISEDVAASIFDPFFTTKSAVTGTGLGLSVSYGIIKDHGGDILINSKNNEGTTFTIVLPI